MYLRITDLSTHVALYLDDSHYMQIRKLYAYNSLYVRTSCHIPLKMSRFATYVVLRKSKKSRIYIKALGFQKLHQYDRV